VLSLIVAGSEWLARRGVFRHLGSAVLVILFGAIAANTVNNPLGAQLLQSYLAPINSTNYPWLELRPGCTTVTCYNQDAFAELVYDGSDTRVALLHGLPYGLAANGTDNGAFATISTTDLLATRTDLADDYGTDRVLATAAVMPNDRIDMQLANMTVRAPSIAAWYTATGWSNSAGDGYYLDDEAGAQMIEEGLELEVPIFLVAKGVPGTSFHPTYVSPRDVGPAALLNPASRFVI